MWSKILTGIKSVNPTLLLYKIAVTIAIGVVIATVAYREGVDDTEDRVAAEQITGLQNQIITERQEVVRRITERTQELQTRIAEIQMNSRQYNETVAELRELKGDLNEAINSRPGNAACAPSVQELRAYDELAERTRGSAGDAVRGGSIRRP